MNHLGIDPGLKGSLALIDPDAKLLDLVDMPTLAVTRSRREIDRARLVGLLRDWQDLCGPFRVTIEQAIVMPRQGAASGFKTGVGYGQVLGILAAMEIEPPKAVAAQRWQKEILGKCEKGTSKDRAVAVASRLWPTADLGSRKSQDRADALCIALYGWQQWTGRAAA